MKKTPGHGMVIAPVSYDGAIAVPVPVMTNSESIETYRCRMFIPNVTKIYGIQRSGFWTHTAE
jgi:hypothetical protein